MVKNWWVSGSELFIRVNTIRLSECLLPSTTPYKGTEKVGTENQIAHLHFHQKKGGTRCKARSASDEGKRITHKEREVVLLTFRLVLARTDAQGFPLALVIPQAMRLTSTHVHQVKPFRLDLHRLAREQTKNAILAWRIAHLFERRGQTGIRWLVI